MVLPHQASCATYVWQPLTVSGGRLALGDYWPAWDPATAEPVELEGAGLEVGFSSAVAGARAEIPVEIPVEGGGRVAVLGRSDRHSGYGRVEVLEEGGRVRSTHLVDFYSLVPHEGVRFVTPALPPGPCRLRIEATGEMPVWFDKAGNRFGAVAAGVTVDRVVVMS